MDDLHLSQRQRKKRRQLAFHERYVKRFEAAHAAGDDAAIVRNLRKAQYWLDRYRGVKGGQRV